jgi:hypothetical protein
MIQIIAGHVELPVKHKLMDPLQNVPMVLVKRESVLQDLLIALEIRDVRHLLIPLIIAVHVEINVVLQLTKPLYVLAVAAE